MKKFFFLLLLFPALVYGQLNMLQEAELDFGRVSFSLVPRVMEDGSVIETSFGVLYNEIFSGDFRYRATIVSRNEKLSNEFILDSLNAKEEKTHELFLLPVVYNFKKDNNLLWIGAGIYYEYNVLREKGFYDFPLYEDYGFARVNSYTNDFSMHVVGPLIDVKFDYFISNFNIRLSGGVVPVFFLSATEKFNIIPMFSNRTENTQTTWGTPYYYFGLDTVFFKFVNIGVSYSFSKMEYEAIDYDIDWDEGTVSVVYPVQTVTGSSIKVEASLLLPMGGNTRFKIGYGYSFDTFKVGGESIEDNKGYLVLGTWKAFD